jgi:hypothetical protein
MRATARPCFLRIAFLALAIALMLATACDKKKAEQQPVSEIDRTGISPLGTTQQVLQKNFKVAAPAIFSFEIPAHAAMPHLAGSYKSYVAKVEIQSSQDSANVDFFVLTDDQYAGYSSDGTIDSLFSATASHDQNVDVSLPPSLTQPKKFYLIFRSTPGSDPTKVVKADLSVNF